MMCGRCWADAWSRGRDDTGKSQVEHYRDILSEREDTPCVECPQCHGTGDDGDPDDGPVECERCRGVGVVRSEGE